MNPNNPKINDPNPELAVDLFQFRSVKEIKNGERLVFVGWIESYVKSIEQREYLFDLDASARSLLAQHGRSDELDLIFKSYSNLLRVMGD